MAKNVWNAISELLGLNIGTDFESIANLWLAKKKHALNNIYSGAILWSLWKTCNALWSSCGNATKMETAAQRRRCES